MNFILFIGIVGSGRKELKDILIQGKEYTLISLEDIRKNITGDAFDLSKEAEVYEKAHTELELALSHDQNVIWDIDIMYIQNLNKLYNILQWYPLYQVIAYEMMSSLDIDKCFNRSKQHYLYKNIGEIVLKEQLEKQGKIFRNLIESQEYKVFKKRNRKWSFSMKNI